MQTASGGSWSDLCLRWVPPYPLGGGWVGLWPVGGWVTLVLGNLAQSAYSPPGGGGGGGGRVGVGGLASPEAAPEGPPPPPLVSKGLVMVICRTMNIECTSNTN